jgi:thiosulfate dehydrogenase [quinone] large subunit
MAFPQRIGIAFSSVGLLSASWLFVRIILGVEWMRGGWEKIGDPGWTKSPVGGAVEGFLRGAIAKSTEGEHPEVQVWFADLTRDAFLPNADVLAYLVAYGELLVGLALIVGLFTRLSVLFGVTMNLAFLFAGTTSTNPQMLVLGLALAAFGSTAGAYGLDRWVLPWLEQKAGPEGVRATQFGIVAAVFIFSAALALIASDAETWIAAAAVAAVALIVFGPIRQSAGLLTKTTR